MATFDNDVKGEKHPATVAEWLARARDLAAKGEDRIREMGEAIERARGLDPTLTQRAIAEQVGHSLGWVNAVTQWIECGYEGRPFAAAKRHEPVSGVQAAEQEDEAVTPPELGEDEDGLAPEQDPATVAAMRCESAVIAARNFDESIMVLTQNVESWPLGVKHTLFDALSNVVDELEIIFLRADK